MSFAFIQQDNSLNSRGVILIFGYIRQTYPLYMPHDIMKLCYDYSKDSLTWKITQNQFKSFQTKAKQTVDDWNYEILSGPMFTIRGFEFECNISIVSRAEFIQFQIRLKSINKSTLETNIQSIIAYYEVHCNETNSSEKDTKILNEIGDEMSWPMYNLRVKECINLQSFTFNIYVDIFKINYKQAIHKNGTNKLHAFHNGKYESLSLSILRNRHYRPIKIHSSIDYKWNINTKLLKQFKQSNFGKYWYSPNFGLDGNEINGKNFAWCVYIAPHGYNHSMNNKVYIGIVLLNMPPKIKKFEINFTIKCELPPPLKDIIHEEIGKIIHYRNNCAAWPGSDDLKIYHLKNIKSECVVIAIHIDIIRVINDKGVEINFNQWDKIGIISKPIWPILDISKSFSWLKYLHQR
eukprot:452500_1